MLWMDGAWEDWGTSNGKVRGNSMDVDLDGMDALANWASKVVDDGWAQKDKSTEERVVDDVVLEGTFVAHADKDVWRKSY